MKQRVRKLEKSKSLKAKRVAVVASRFNENICEGLLSGALGLLTEVQVGTVKIVRVPGAFEMPLAAQKLARTKKYAGIVCLGAVIRGDTAHFDYVCKAVTEGLLRVMLDESLPVGFGVITVDTMAQALERSRPDEFNKGRDAAQAVVEMIGNIYG